MKNQITQVHNISPEDLKKEIVTDVVSDVRAELKEFSKKLQSKEPSEYITSKETAKFLKITLPTLYDWRLRGVVTAYRIANKIRYKLSEVEGSLKKIDIN